MSGKRSVTFRTPTVKRLPTSFEANIKEKYVVAIMQIGESTIGVRFESPEMMLTFFSELMEKAAVVWPESELIKEYLAP